MEINFLANPGGQAAFVEDWTTPISAIAGGTGSGKTEALVLLHHVFSFYNRGISGWVSETGPQFKDVAYPKILGVAEEFFGWKLEKAEGFGGWLILYPFKMRGRQLKDWGAVTNGYAAIMVRTAENAIRIAGPDWTHATCDEVDRWPMHPSNQKRDPWMQVPTRVRVPCPYSRIRAGGTHEGTGQLGRYFYRNGPEAWEICEACGAKRAMLVGRGLAEGPIDGSHGGIDRDWIQICQECHASFPSARLYRASTRDNPHLSPRYLNTLLAGLKQKQRESYIDGHYIELGAGKAVGNWTSRNCAPVMPDMAADWIGLCCDFNVGVLHWSIIQECHGCHLHDLVGATGGWHVPREFREIGYASTKRLIGEVITWLLEIGWTKPVRLMGDPNGSKRSQTTNETDYGQISESLTSAGFEVEWCVMDDYPGVKQSLTLLNTACHDIGFDIQHGNLVEVDHGRRLLVNDAHAPYLVNDFEEARKHEAQTEGGTVMIDKVFHDPHGMDGVRYAIWALSVNADMDAMPYAVAGKSVDVEHREDRAVAGTTVHYEEEDEDDLIIDETRGWNDAEDFD